MTYRKPTLAERVRLFLGTKGDNLVLLRSDRNRDRWDISEVKGSEVERLAIFHEEDGWVEEVERQLLSNKLAFESATEAIQAFVSRLQRKSRKSEQPSV